MQEQVDHLETLWTAGKFPEALELSASLRPQVEALDYAPLRAQTLFHLGRLHAGLGDYAQADALLRQTLTQAARAHDDVLLARVWSMLVFNAEIRMSRRPDVLELEQVVLETTVERAGDDLARAEALHSLGGVLYKVGRFEEARDRFQRAGALMEKALGPEHPFVASMYNNVGVTLADLGRFEEARVNYERALAIFQKALGPEHPEVANTSTSLGRTLVRAQHLDEAEHHLQSALSLGQKALGPEHPQAAEALLGLGEMYLARGQAAQALAPLEKALAMIDSFYRAEVQFTLARALYDSGREHKRARQLATESLEHYQRLGNQPRAEEVSQWLVRHFGALPPKPAFPASEALMTTSSPP